MKQLKCNNTRIIGVPEGEERELGIENVFEETMTKNVPNLVKKKHTSPGSTESPKEDEPKEVHNKTHHI